MGEGVCEPPLAARGLALPEAGVGMGVASLASEGVDPRARGGGGMAWRPRGGSEEPVGETVNERSESVN